MSYKAQRYQPNNSLHGGHNGNRRFSVSKHKPRTFDPTTFIQTIKPITSPTNIEYISQHKFIDFNIHPQVQANIIARNYIKPTPIQDQAIPHILAGKDVVGIANTGTGKTAAFLIPLIHRITLAPASKVLIITPTRELAVQIQEEFQAFAQRLNIYSTLCIGGVSINNQINKLSRQPHFVIGTPGRLKDLESRGKLNFKHFSTIVLDEVDRMLDMGFIHDVKHIVSQLPSPRISLFFSATITATVRQVMNTFLTNPVTVQIRAAKPAENVNQDIIRTNGKRKVDVLHELLVQKDFQKVLVFGRTKWGINKLERHLHQLGHRVASIHGNKTQGQRQRALVQFKSHHIDVLLATDVASRGLDIDSVTHVINYDLPETLEDYIHRIGRTGRADQTGIALTFVE